MENTSETKKYIKIGSMGDTQLTTPQRIADYDHDGDNAAVTKTPSGITLSNEDLKFDIALSDVNDSGIWIGNYDYRIENLFGNGVEDVQDDSAVTWHWAYELYAGKTRNTYALSGAMSATYTVAFDTNGGSTVPTQGVNEGGKAEKPDDPTKEGYTFAGIVANEDSQLYFGEKRSEPFTIKAADEKPVETPVIDVKPADENSADKVTSDKQTTKSEDKKTESKAETAAAAATTANPATGAAAGMGLAGLAAAAMVVSKRKNK